MDDYGTIKYAYKNFVHTCLVMKFTKYNGVTLEELREVYLNYDNFSDYEKQEAIRERKEQVIAGALDFLYWKLYNKYSPSKQLSIVLEVCEMFSAPIYRKKIIKERNKSMYWINAVMSFDDFDLTSQLIIDS